MGGIVAQVAFMVAPQSKKHWAVVQQNHLNIQKYFLTSCLCAQKVKQGKFRIYLYSTTLM